MQVLSQTRTLSHFINNTLQLAVKVDTLGKNYCRKIYTTGYHAFTVMNSDRSSSYNIWKVAATCRCGNRIRRCVAMETSTTRRGVKYQLLSCTYTYRRLMFTLQTPHIMIFVSHMYKAVTQSHLLQPLVSHRLIRVKVKVRRRSLYQQTCQTCQWHQQARGLIYASSCIVAFEGGLYMSHVTHLTHVLSFDTLTTDNHTEELELGIGIRIGVKVKVL